MESSIESLIKSKGFADCVVSIGEGRADITVMTENDALTADEVTASGMPFYASARA